MRTVNFDFTRNLIFRVSEALRAHYNQFLNYLNYIDAGNWKLITGFLNKLNYQRKNETPHKDTNHFSQQNL